MRERHSLPMKSAVRRTTLAVDVVVLSPRGDALAALLVRAPAGARERWTLPWDAPRPDEGLEDAASRIAESVLGSAPAFFEQVGAFSDGKRHPGDADVSVGIVALVPARDDAPAPETEWFSLTALPTLAPRHRTIVERAAAVAPPRGAHCPRPVRGRAATVKSTLLGALRDFIPYDYGGVAPTGLAAVTAAGQTIHSFFG
ncbi:MAG: NUDIX domain-containing protein, partial [Gemmatimonadaceae bacterium]|nr:NUDIX domain-containing protein [Gemmatimonadaceae bacterium]